MNAVCVKLHILIVNFPLFDESVRNIFKIIFTVVPCILILSEFFHQLMHKRLSLKGVLKFALTIRLLMSYIYIYICIYDISSLGVNDLTLILLTWRKWCANNASKYQMRFNSAFKGLNIWLPVTAH